MARDEAPVGGAVFVLDRDGDLDVYADAAYAAGSMEFLMVEDDEYVTAYRVDGAVLAIASVRKEERVVLTLTGEVDAAALQALVDDAVRRSPAGTATAGVVTPLDYAEAWFAGEWNRRWVRWPHWLDRWLHGAGPWTREQLQPAHR
ncbi:hypothetical protein [Pseudokineococcus lusitanus]|uniref:hypothetical protein n=1 Tax=Pseudokineococcus lusitanus TaxID=763993 RepID=UPI000F49AC74|nr:hypothetical protein [Pseudokineococcus lusitanus]